VFRTLLAHFSRRLVQSGSEDSGSVDMSLGATLALLASPGVFIAIGLMDRYSSLLRYLRGVPIVDDPYPRATGDGYGLLVFSMAVTGLVTLWKWDRILPDVTDRLNLGPLPIPARTLFLSSLAAIALVVGVFIIDVNAGSMLIFPMVVTADQSSAMPFLRLAFAHTIVLLLGSLFSFCFCFSLMGVLIALAPSAWFGGLSILLRSAAGFSLLSMWILAGKGGLWLRLARTGSATWQEWLPPLWFASLYGPLIGRPELGVPALWQRGLWALAIVVSLALAGYGIGYRRGMDGRLARSAWRSRWPAWLLSHGATPLERAGFRFTLQTLWRSESHSLLIVSLVGAGIVIGAMRGDMARLPFFAGYSLIVAIRIAFGVPASPAANWPFRLLSIAQPGEPARIARRILWLHFAALVLLPTLLFYPLWTVLALLLTHSILIEALLLDFRQIPFTLRPAGFRNTRLVHALLAVIGLAFVPFLGSGIASRMASHPIRALIPIAITAILFYYRRHAVDALTAGRPPLTFESVEEDVIRLRL